MNLPTQPPTDRQISAVTRAAGEDTFTDAQRHLLVEVLDALGSALKVTAAMDDPALGAFDYTRRFYGELADAVSGAR